MQSLLLRHLLGRGLFDALLPEPLWKRLWEPTLGSSWNQPSPAQLGGMLSCLVIAPSAVAAVLPTAVPLWQQPCPFVPAERRRPLGAVVLLVTLFHCLLGRGVGGDVMGFLREVDRRNHLYINIGSGFNSYSQDWDQAWSRCTPRACLSWTDACWNVYQTWE